MTTMVFLAASNFSVVVLPLFFSRTTMVPVLSLLETTCNCGLFITTILAAAKPGFFLINSGSSPACLALCIKKKPRPARATITKITSAAKTPTIHRMTFAPEDLGGAGGIPPGICGLIDGVDIAFSSFEGGYFCGGTRRLCSIIRSLQPAATCFFALIPSSPRIFACSRRVISPERAASYSSAVLAPPALLRAAARAGKGGSYSEPPRCKGPAASRRFPAFRRYRRYGKRVPQDEPWISRAV